MQLEPEFNLLDELLNIIVYPDNKESICPLCFNSFDNICNLCGFFYDRQIYKVYDLHNYKKIQNIHYKKLTHFKEVLNNFQGKEFKKIPYDIINNIMYYVNNDISSISIHVIKSFLKKNKLTKYVENTYAIFFELTGINPPYIPKVTELKLLKYFKCIENVFNECKTFSRVNFLNYYYVLYKLLELINEVDLLYYVPLIKSKYRIIEHDNIWRNVCLSLNWKFIKTIPK